MPGFLLLLFFFAILRQNLSDVFSYSCLLEYCLATISGHDSFFVCLFVPVINLMPMVLFLTILNKKKYQL